MKADKLLLLARDLVEKLVDAEKEKRKFWKKFKLRVDELDSRLRDFEDVKKLMK